MSAYFATLLVKIQKSYYLVLSTYVKHTSYCICDQAIKQNPHPTKYKKTILHAQKPKLSFYYFEEISL